MAFQQLDLFDETLAVSSQELIRRFVNNVWKEISKLERRQQLLILQQLQFTLDAQLK